MPTTTPKRRFYYFNRAITIAGEDGFAALVKAIARFLDYKSNHFLSRVYFSAFKKPVIKNLKKFNTSDNEILFDFISKEFMRVFAPIQIKEEFLELLNIFKEKNPKTIVEIGTARGGTLFCWCKLASNEATIIGIDLPSTMRVVQVVNFPFFFQSFTKEGQKLYLLREDSHSEKTLELLKGILNGQKIDFLFIDGDHSYEGVKKDFEMYSPLVDKGGIIASHDINPNGAKEWKCDVPDFWKEIKDNHLNKEFINDEN